MTRLPTAEETRALSRAVAEVLDTDEAWMPAETCPQGHRNVDGDTGGPLNGIGVRCVRCEDIAITNAAGEHSNMAEWWSQAKRIQSESHPEWSIPRGEPKPYAESIDLAIKAADALRGAHWTLARYDLARTPGGDDRALAIIVGPAGAFSVERWAPTPAIAMCEAVRDYGPALRAALAEERGR